MSGTDDQRVVWTQRDSEFSFRQTQTQGAGEQNASDLVAKPDPELTDIKDLLRASYEAHRTGDDGAELRLLDEILSTRDRTEPSDSELRVLLAYAVVNKGMWLSQHHRDHEAFELAEELVHQLHAETAPLSVATEVGEQLFAFVKNAAAARRNNGAVVRLGEVLAPPAVVEAASGDARAFVSVYYASLLQRATGQAQRAQAMAEVMMTAGSSALDALSALEEVIERADNEERLAEVQLYRIFVLDKNGHRDAPRLARDYIKMWENSTWPSTARYVSILREAIQGEQRPGSARA